MDSSEFDFISSKSLRVNIVDSVKFVGWLWVLAQKVEREYQDEMVRTIILYNISIIEALLLFRAKREGLDFYNEAYLHASALPKLFQHTNQQLVVAYRERKKRDEARIWFHELIRENKSFLGVALQKQVSDLQNIRNTFHLSRVRRELSLEKAERSFDVVLKLVAKIQKEYAKN